MAGDEGKHLLLFPGLMHRQGSTAGAGHACSLPGFPPQIHLPLPMPVPVPGVYPPTPGTYAYARPGAAYAYAHAHTYAYPPPSGPYAYPPQGYPGSFSSNQGHGSRSHGGGRQVEIAEPLPKAGYPQPGASPGSFSPNLQLGHGSGRHIETAEPEPKTGAGMEKEPLPKAGGGATASATAFGAISNLYRGHGSRNNDGAFGCFKTCCGQHGSMFKYAGHGHQQGQFKQHGGRRPGKVEHVHGKFCAKCTTWKE